MAALQMSGFIHILGNILLLVNFWVDLAVNFVVGFDKSGGLDRVDMAISIIDS